MIGKLIASAFGGFSARWGKSAAQQIAALFEQARQLAGAGRHAAAVDVYRELLRKQPANVDALSASGDLLWDLNRHEEASRCYESAVALHPDNRKLLFKLGNLYWLMGRLTDAEACFSQILALAPRDAQALNNLGLVRQEEGDPLQAERFYRAAIESDPGYVEAKSNLLLCLNYQDQRSAESVYREHTAWAQEIISGIAQRAVSFPDGAHKRLRVGYVSPDFKTHSVTYFFEPLLRLHDSSGFEIFCYDDASRPDAVTERLRAGCEHWRIIAGASDDDVAKVIRQDEIDILVELAGHTADNRLRLLARRVAPIQVTYLGYPNTTGVAAIDYRITDAVADPVGVTDSLHCERLVRLPVAWCYLPPQDAPPIIERSSDATSVTFGSFNKIAKLSDRAIRTWSRVLQDIPGSSLLLKCSALNDAEVAARLKQRFIRCGIDADRIRTVGFAKDNREHMAMYGEVDIALDTFPYCGTTTTCEALYMGVPVVTLSGNTHVGRVGASLLSALGRKEWIADSEDRFVEIVRSLAQHLPHLVRLRKSLRDEMAASPLLDGLKFTRSLENLYRGLHARH
jgi:predicted O-linked N-acetylglucosamine transferase (SPINDLY family)